MVTIKYNKHLKELNSCQSPLGTLHDRLGWLQETVHTKTVEWKSDPPWTVISQLVGLMGLRAGWKRASERSAEEGQRNAG